MPRLAKLGTGVHQADIQNWLAELKVEHRDLDEVIHYLVDTKHPDLMKIQRLKKTASFILM